MVLLCPAQKYFVWNKKSKYLSWASEFPQLDSSALWALFSCWFCWAPSLWMHWPFLTVPSIGASLRTQLKCCLGHNASHITQGSCTHPLLGSQAMQNRALHRYFSASVASLLGFLERMDCVLFTLYFQGLALCLMYIRFPIHGEMNDCLWLYLVICLPVSFYVAAAFTLTGLIMILREVFKIMKLLESVIRRTSISRIAFSKREKRMFFCMLPYLELLSSFCTSGLSSLFWQPRGQGLCLATTFSAQPSLGVLEALKKDL